MEDNTQQQTSSPADAYIAAVQSGNAPAVTPQPSSGPDDSGFASPAVASPQSGRTNAPAQVASQPAPNPAHAFIKNFAGSGSGSSASNFWRSLVSSAIVGMGAGDAAPVIQGPYGPIKSTSIGGAASRGFQAGSQLAEQQQDRARKQAQQDADQKRKDQESKIELDDATLRKAADARAQQASIQNSVEHERRMTMLGQSIDKGNWEQTQRTAKAAQDQVNFLNGLHDVGATPLADKDGNPLQFATHEEAEKAAHDDPKFFIGDFKTRTAFDASTGKYSIYRLPDTDIKNVQLKDRQGNVHTIPRMSPTEYLDFQSRVQKVQKGALEVSKVGAEIGRLQSDRKAGGVYGNALKELTGATDKDGNINLDKISGGSRTVLYEHSAKGLEDASRAMSAAVKKREDAQIAGDQEGLDEANQQISALRPLVQNYGDTLSALHGKPKAAQPNSPQAQSGPSPKVQTAVEVISHLPKDQQKAQIDASSLSPAEKQAAKNSLGLK